MKPHRLSSGLALAALLAACAGPPLAPRADLVGAPVPAAAATRTITITPDTRSVDIIGGDVVRFVSGDKVFAWSFNVSPIVRVFDLNQVAPPGMLDHPVLVYVMRDPRYFDESKLYGLSR